MPNRTDMQRWIGAYALGVYIYFLVGWILDALMPGMAWAQTITIDPTTPQGVFDGVVWQTIGCFTAGNIVGVFIKLTNRS